jgi:Yip1 domain
MEESGFGRLFAVLFAPTKTFESIARRPTWVLAIVVFVALALAVTVVVTPRVDMAEIMRASMESSGREVDVEKLEAATSFMEKFQWPLAIGSALVVQPAIYFLLGLIFWVAFKVGGGDMNYQTSLAVALHGFVPGAVAALLTIPVVLGRDSLDYEMVKTGSFLASNAAAFAPEGSGAFATSLLSSLDVFSFWSLALLTIGYRLAAKVSRGTAIGVIVGLWAVYVLGKSGFAALTQ